jgi:hypothetical protein
VWSADCIGYPAGKLTPLLEELMRVVKPGGEVILLGWSSQQLLPGYPLLEARLNATCSGYIPFLKEKSPDLNFMRASHWFRQAGLEDVKAQTFVGEVQSPISSSERTTLISLFDMLWAHRSLKPLQRIGGTANRFANRNHQILFSIILITTPSLPIRCSGAKLLLNKLLNLSTRTV